MDENVFEIQTGVAVCQLTKAHAPGDAAIEYAELVGTYALKAAKLFMQPPALKYVAVPAEPRSYLSFLPSQGERHTEYWDYPQLDSFFYQSVDGIKTSRDGLVIANTHRECVEKIRAFGADESAADVEASFERSRLDLDKARHHVATTFDRSKIHKIAYRPYDIRFIYYDSELIVSHRMNTMPRILGNGSEAIVCASRLSAKGFSHAFASRSLCSNKYTSHDINSRMFLVASHEARLSESGLQSGVRPEWLAAALVPSDLPEVERAKLFGSYVLAILNAPSYRDRFVEDIHQDFPRVPLPGSLALMKELAAVGSAMFDAHCLAIDAPNDRFLFHGHLGEPCASPKLKGTNLWIGRTSYIEGVRSELWEFQMAGYCVCSSWFTAGGRSNLARKTSRLSKELVEEFRRVLFCAMETIKLRAAADEVIDRHGGWPRAFQTARAVESAVEAIRRVAEPHGEYGSPKPKK